MPISRRESLLLPLLGLAGCTTTVRSSPFWATIKSGIIGTPKDPAISRSASDSLPYANIVAWFEGTPSAILVLGTINPGNILDWYTRDGKMISTKGPFVVRAIGFDVDLRDMRFGRGWNDNLTAMVGGRPSRTAIYQPGTRVEILFESTFHRRGMKQITILGKSYELEKFEERVSSGGQHRFSNHYWIDPGTGFCWQSQQKIIPTEPSLNIGILKPAKLT